MTILNRIVSVLLLGIFQLYRNIISPHLPPSCRYTPSCSAYAVEAVKKHGGIHGGWLAIKRIFSCHPWGGQGHDPVP